MAFLQRADGLVDVDTPAGPMPMAPEMAMQLGWTPGTPEATVTPPPAQMAASAGLPGAPMGLSPEDMSTLGLPPQEQAAAHAYADPALASAMNSTDASQLAKQVPMQAAPAQQAHVASGPGPMEKLALSLPGGRESSTTNRTGPAPVTGQRRTEIDRSLDSQLMASQMGASAQGALADLATQQATLEAGQARDMAQADAIRRQEMDRRLADLRAKREASRAAVPDKLDPNKWDKTGGVGQVLAAVSLMLGAISQGISGRENPARPIIDGLIARSIESQREEIRQAELLHETAQNEYSDALAMYGDPILAEMQLQMNGHEAVKKEMQARIQGASSDVVKAAAAQGIAEQEGEIARIRNDMDGRGGTIAQQSQFEGESAAETQGRIMAGRAQDQSVNDPFAGMNEASIRDATASIVRLPDGRQVYATSKENATASRQIMEAVAQYKANIGRIKEIMQKGGNLNPKGADFAELNTRIASNATMVKNIEQLGALVGADWGIVDPLSGKDAASWTQWDEATARGLNTAVEIYQNRLKDVEDNLFTDPRRTQPLTGGKNSRRKTEQKAWK